MRFKIRVSKCSLIRHLLCSIVISALREKMLNGSDISYNFEKNISAHPLLKKYNEAGFSLLIDI